MYIKKLFPHALLEKLPANSSDLAAGFIQWALGSCVFALFSAAVTLAVTYPLFLHFSRRQQKHA